MKKGLQILLSISFLALGVAVHAAFVPTDDGIYAQFAVTHNSTAYEFTASLHYQEAPVTVLNFIELAEGSKDWFNSVGFSKNHTPFYNGVTFHRVISGFVIQTGSRNGLGSDGPGFQFPDEMDASLTHSGPGILSMANSGANSNGSQFFITLAATPNLDGKHSVFGVIVDGLPDVTALGEVPVDGDDRPVSDMTINSVTIIRVGTEANNFSSTGLLRPQYRQLVQAEIITAAGPAYRIRIPNRDTTYGHQLYGTNDLASNNWGNLFYAGPNFNADADFDISINSLLSTQNKYFFNVVESEVGSRVDGTGLNYTFSLVGFPDIVLNLTSATAGTYTYNGESGALNFYELHDQGGRYQLYFQMSGFFPFQVYFEKGVTSGPVFAHIIANSEFNLTGTFTSP